MMFVIRERSGEGRFMCVMGVCCHQCRVTKAVHFSF
jgi:hypothetical protein